MIPREQVERLAERWVYMAPGNRDGLVRELWPIIATLQTENEYLTKWHQPLREQVALNAQRAERAERELAVLRRLALGCRANISHTHGPRVHEDTTCLACYVDAALAQEPP